MAEDTECQTIEADCEAEGMTMLPVGSLERAAAKERIRLEYVAGRGTLLALATRERISYSTVMRWSSEDGWNIAKAKVQEKTDSTLVDKVADWMAEQREVQIKTAIKRARRMQKAIDQSLGEEDAVLLPAELQALASAEERMDNIARRNLGMDGQTQQSAAVSINILAGGIQLS